MKQGDSNIVRMCARKAIRHLELRGGGGGSIGLRGTEELNGTTDERIWTPTWRRRKILHRGHGGKAEEILRKTATAEALRTQRKATSKDCRGDSLSCRRLPSRWCGGRGLSVRSGTKRLRRARPYSFR